MSIKKKPKRRKLNGSRGIASGAHGTHYQRKNETGKGRNQGWRRCSSPALAKGGEGGGGGRGRRAAANPRGRDRNKSQTPVTPEHALPSGLMTQPNDAGMVPEGGGTESGAGAQAMQIPYKRQTQP